jgi:hypothetical protein
MALASGAQASAPNAFVQSPAQLPGATPNSPAHGLLFTRLQKSVHAAAIAGEPPELVAPPVAGLPAIPVPGPAGTLDEPPAPVTTPGPGLEGVGPGPLEVPLPAAAPALLLGTELPSEGSLSSVSVDVRPPHAARTTIEARPTQFETEAVIPGIYRQMCRRTNGPARLLTKPPETQGSCC